MSDGEAIISLIKGGKGDVKKDARYAMPDPGSRI